LQARIAACELARGLLLQPFGTRQQPEACERAGEFARFELLPRMGNRPRFSGKKVQAWLDGEDDAVESRYFKAGRRALRGVK